MVGIEWEGYKYIPYALISLAHLFSWETPFMCKGVQEPSEEIVIWESKIKDLISA
jgi:hypothetical protein